MALAVVQSPCINIWPNNKTLNSSSVVIL